MEKIKELTKKYSKEIIILLGAISSIAASIATMDANAAAFSSIIIAIVAVLIELFSHGITEQFITLLSKAILIIIEEIKKVDVKDDASVMKASTKKELTVDDIKKRLTEM